MKMKAISLYQPWASLMALGHKRIETRSWATSYRGPLAIHAAKKLVMPDDPEFREALEKLGLIANWDGKNCSWPKGDFPRGAIVGVCNLHSCVPVGLGPILENYERLFGDYSPGRYLWLTTDMKKLNNPIPCIGRQGFWDWNEEA